MCCDNCQLEKTDPELYKLKTDWLGHAQWEDFYHTNHNYYMAGYHKGKRLELEKKIQEHNKVA